MILMGLGLPNVRSGLIGLLLVTCNPVLPASGSTKPAPPLFLAREVVRRVVRHPDGSKNKICQRAPVLESEWRPSSNYHCCLAVTILWEWFQE